jgi:DNA-binding NtrC family response regulator
MSESHLSVLTVRPTRRRNNARKRGEYLVFHCLIASRSAERQEMMARAVVESGWEPVLCSDAQEVFAHQSRGFAQLAIVDFESDSTGEFQELLARLSATTGLLTVACGNEGRPQEEVLARQAGAWLYLPGVADAASLSGLCSEAKQLVERLHVANSEKRSLRRTA